MGAPTADRQPYDSVRGLAARNYNQRTSMPLVPQVSVVLPVYNGGAFLKLAVDSILAQTFVDFELIVVNDGSNDGATDRLQSTADPRLRVIDLPVNRGTIAASNLGLSRARGSLIAMMDADDIAEPVRLAAQVAEFDATPELALLGSCASLIDAQGRRFGTIRPPLSTPEIRSRMFVENAFVHTSVMFRTDIVRRLGCYNPLAKHAQDYELFLRVALDHQCKNLDRALVGYRVHGAQDSLNNMAKQREMASKVQRDVWAEALGRGLADGCAPPPAQTPLRRLRGAPGTLGADYRSWASVYARMGRQRESIRIAMHGLRHAPLSLALYALIARSCVWWLVPSMADAHGAVRLA